MKLNNDTKRALAILQFAFLAVAGVIFLVPVRLALTAIVLAIVCAHAHWSVALALALVVGRLEFSAWASSRRAA
jgi:fatty acid desaturase